MATFCRYVSLAETEEEKILVCARAAHEANRIWCEAHNDRSQPCWENAPAWMTTSAIKGVRGVLAGNTPSDSHESWLREKEETGWKYGPVKDAEKKEHPCMVAYDDLPEEQKHKDYIFVNVVQAFAEGFGLL